MAVQHGESKPAETLLLSKRVITMAAGPVKDVSAVSVRHGNILEVGPRHTTDRTCGPETEVLDFGYLRKGFFFELVGDFLVAPFGSNRPIMPNNSVGVGCNKNRSRIGH